MRKKVSEEKFENIRMLSIAQAQDYCGLGRTLTRKLAEDAGAIMFYGRRVLVDRKKLDEALDKLMEKGIVEYEGVHQD